jgi:hypothetical protein
MGSEDDDDHGTLRFTPLPLAGEDVAEGDR